MLRRIGCLVSRGLRPERGGGRPGWRAEGVPLKPWGKLSQADTENARKRAYASKVVYQVGMVYWSTSVSPGMIEIITRTGFALWRPPRPYSSGVQQHPCIRADRGGR